MIPKKLHYCWFGKGPKSALNQRCMATWHEVLHDYALKEWNEANSPLGLPYTRAAYRRGEWSRLSNYVRLHALRMEGGVYLDTDVEVLKPLDPLLAYDGFLGFQVQEHPTDWVNGAVAGSVPGHPFPMACMARLDKEFKAAGQLPRLPQLLTTMLRERGLATYGFQEIMGVTLLPVECFYPYSWMEAFTPECVTEATCCVHHWEKSWRKRRGPLAAGLQWVRDLPRRLARRRRR